MPIPRFLRLLLLPVSWLYDLATTIRNLLYDKGILTSHTFPFPTICVGNITVGGTGKTPHVEYIADLLTDKCAIGIVSRGYRRKTKGLIVADSLSTAEEIGDEPMQIKKHFPNAHVAVCKSRAKAVEALLAQNSEQPIGAILLDDAFQHRKIAAGLNILLIDYGRSIFNDYVLPAGMLRESHRGISRADIIVITKCPPHPSLEKLENLVARSSTDRANNVMHPTCDFFFTTMCYAAPYKLLSGEKTTLHDIAEKHMRVVVLAGIARPAPFVEEVKHYCKVTKELIFGDHHSFSLSDIANIEKCFTHDQCSAIITTEKDAARLTSHIGQISRHVLENIYVIPVKVTFLFGKQTEFNNKILDYVQQNQANG